MTIEEITAKTSERLSEVEAEAKTLRVILDALGYKEPPARANGDKPSKRGEILQFVREHGQACASDIAAEFGDSHRECTRELRKIGKLRVVGSALSPKGRGRPENVYEVAA